MYLKQCEVESRVEYFKGDIQEIIKSKKTIKKWAYILHDKDDTAPHYHIYLNFGNSGVDTKQVAEWFGLQESQVSRIRGRSTDMLLYLTHGNDSPQNKHQYPPTEVIANFDFQTEIKNAKILGDFDHFSYPQQIEYVNGLPLSEKSAAFRQLENLWKLQCKILTLQTDRDIEVIFITGKGGTGKTTYAKKLLRKRNLDVCVSSSSNDPWQDYLGQRAMLLDDCRDKTFDKFEDFLKIIDNHTQSSVQSRFNNKCFNGEVIVITSSVPLRYWYRGKNSKGIYFSLQDEDFVQLYRRITMYVEITKEEIAVYPEGLTDKGYPKGLAETYVNDLFVKQEQKQIRKRSKFADVFKELCEPVTTDIFDTQQLSISDEKSDKK